MFVILSSAKDLAIVGLGFQTGRSETGPYIRHKQILHFVQNDNVWWAVPTLHFTFII